MEAAIYYKDNTIEKSRIPEFVGGSATNSPWEGVSETSNVIDTVRGIRERFYRDETGFWLECTVDKPVGISYDSDGAPKMTEGAITKRICIVTDAMLDTVKLIALDGEQVYPAVEARDEFDMAF